ncbi:MAG TPA: NCS2 family permease [Candidatus Coproplasma excrementigallinarum]|uniref:NCS2 family permease n=1 Tax=Candidatus Coproplasma excrementigallinarum TaxID=2840747 RepID=A0A9D1SID5_9FIRM|nr:NCS2 family permease [Candidatus Coproplasma excrementigallinarum]
MEEQKEEVVAAESATEAPAEEKGGYLPPKKQGFWEKVDNWFGITKSGSNYRTEFVAGLTTFMAMVYILMVNANMFAGAINPADLDMGYGAAYIATAIGAIVGTMLMAFLAKMPLAQASGMGINAFIVFSLIGGYSGLSYANTMVFVLLDGVIFLILTATGLRRKLFEAIPAGVRHAIPVGIGMFIAFIGMQQAGIIVNDASIVNGQISTSTITELVSFNILGTTEFMTYNSGTVGGMMPAIVAIVGVLAIAILSKKNVKGAVLWGILGSAILYYVLAGIAVGCDVAAATAMFNAITIPSPFDAFAAWGKESVGVVFYEGFNFQPFIEANGAGSFVVVLITSALSLCMIDMFDTIGTLYGACSKGNLLDENGTPIRMEKMMLADAIATCTGAIAGTSTVTTFVESSSGVVAGGRTGFTALVTGLLFVVAMFLSPIAQLIPRSATATALIWVGVLMMTSVTKIDWADAADAIVAFMTFMVMLLGYSISKGIGVGIITFIIVRICTGKVKEISIPTWVIGVIFLLTFLFTN